MFGLFVYVVGPKIFECNVNLSPAFTNEELKDKKTWLAFNHGTLTFDQ